MEIIELTADTINQYLEECRLIQPYLSDGEFSDEQFVKTAAAECNYFLAIVDSGRVAGLGVINKIVHPVRTNAYIDNIVVHPDFRGRGLFKVIMDTLEAKAFEWEAEGVKLTCSRSEVQLMYEKRGYVEKTSTKYYVKKL